MKCPGFTLRQREILDAGILEPLSPKMPAGRSQNPFPECGGFNIQTGGDPSAQLLCYMQKNMKLVTILQFTLLWLSATTSFAESIILPIPNTQIEYGCGCSYRLNDSAPYKFVFQSEPNYENPKVYISGELIKLEPIKIEQIPDKPKIGDTFSQQFRYKDINLHFFNTITFVCPNGSEGGCEVTRFKTKLTIDKAGKVETMDLFGDCGC
ncbi:MAG: hypothetical protein AB1724_02940 [Thermodesulfobacteriota bacterium]